ncbi:MAG TPA: nitrilase-related carbon-nitrogen hydrolase, partial [Armatimonadota bacterium]|nr:nitrilase-related carbon-nitrogen hydrolase [Armatimonadota bacterium]
MRVLSVNISSLEGDIAGNVARACETIRAAGPADLVILPEIFTCGYCARDLTPWAEDVSSPTFATFQALAAERDCVLGWGFAAPSGVPGKVYNAYAVAEPGRAPQVYYKTHLHPYLAGHPFNEPEFIIAGDRLGLVETRFGKL